VRILEKCLLVHLSKRARHEYDELLLIIKGTRYQL
jgi:hypothetical protein